jgi:hypothetical protein
MRELEKCADEGRIAFGPRWDEWVRDLAKICPEIGIVPSGEGPDRSIANQSSSFAKLIRRLQAELPEICTQHESSSKSAEASFAKSVRRALNHRRTNIRGAKGKNAPGK